MRSGLSQIISREGKKFGDLQRADLATLSAAILDYPHLQHVLRVADLPCRSLSEADLQRHGSQGTHGSLIVDCRRFDNKVLRLVLPDVCGEMLVENVFPRMVRSRLETSTIALLPDFCPIDDWPANRCFRYT